MAASGVLTAATSFAALGVAEWLQRSCATMRIVVPTPIQHRCIPAILAGRDVIGCAATGSGKTAAFALPILQALMRDPFGPFALILEPSRELAVQVAEQFAAFGAPSGVRVCTIVGGMDQVAQGVELSKLPHIIVATPGRLAHHISLGSSPVPLGKLRFLVLDEADRLLEPSFAPDLRTILQHMHACSSTRGAGEPSAVSSAAVAAAAAAGVSFVSLKPMSGGAGTQSAPPQVLLFSATITPDAGDLTVLPGPRAGREARSVEAAAPRHVGSGPLAGLLTLCNPLTIDVSPADPTAAVTVPTLRQQYLLMPAAVKHAYLVQVLEMLLAPAALAPAVAARVSRAAAGGGAGARAGLARATEDADERVARLTTGKALLGGRGTAAASGVVAAGDAASAEGGSDEGSDDASAASSFVDYGSGEEDAEDESDGSEGGADAGADCGSAGGSSSSSGGNNSGEEEEEKASVGRAEVAGETLGVGGGGASAIVRAPKGGTRAAAPVEAEAGWGRVRSAIVFAATCRSCQVLCELLIESGIPCVALHSVMKQSARLATLAKFKSSLVRVLVATDVASRGLDIPTVDLVLNYDVPRVPSDYIHRVGRTARAGRAGRALTFVSQHDLDLLAAIEASVLHGAQLRPLAGVPEASVLARLSRVAQAHRLAQSRLAEAGFDDDADVHTRRKRASAARVRSLYDDHPLRRGGEESGGRKAAESLPAAVGVTGRGAVKASPKPKVAASSRGVDRG